VAAAFFQAELGPLGAPERLIASQHWRGHRYLVSQSRPTLIREFAKANACATLGPVLADARVSRIIATANGVAATAEQVAFALGAVLEAQRRMPGVRCRSDDGARCRGIDVTLGTIDARGISSLDLVACPAQRTTWCVEAALERENPGRPNGPIRVKIMTDDRVHRKLDPLRPAVRSAVIATELRPIA
jgi:hypothetical protein